MLQDFYNAGIKKAERDFSNPQFIQDTEAIKNTLKTAPNPHWAAGYLKVYLEKTGKMTNNLSRHYELYNTYLQAGQDADANKTIEAIFEGGVKAAVLPGIAEIIFQLQPTPFKGIGNTPFALAARYKINPEKAFELKDKVIDLFVNDPFTISRAKITSAEKEYIQQMQKDLQNNRVLGILRASPALGGLMTTVIGSIAAANVKSDNAREKIPLISTLASVPMAVSQLYTGIQTAKPGSRLALLLGAGKAAATLGAPYFITKSIVDTYKNETKNSKVQNILNEFNNFKKRRS